MFKSFRRDNAHFTTFYESMSQILKEEEEELEDDELSQTDENGNDLEKSDEFSLDDCVDNNVADGTNEAEML